jgi:hypothetical protein
LGQQLFLLVFSSLKLTGLNSKIRIEKAFMDPEKSWFFRIALRGISAIRGEWENTLNNIFPLIIGSMNIFWTGFMPPIIREIGSAIFGTNFQNLLRLRIKSRKTQVLKFPRFQQSIHRVWVSRILGIKKETWKCGFYLMGDGDNMCLTLFPVTHPPRKEPTIEFPLRK